MGKIETEHILQLYLDKMRTCSRTNLGSSMRRRISRPNINRLVVCRRIDSAKPVILVYQVY